MPMEIKCREDLPCLLNEAKLFGYGAEIGVLRGQFSLNFLEKWDGKKLYMIDAWRIFRNPTDSHNIGNKYPLVDLTDTFKRIYKFNKKAVIIRDFSIDASAIFKDDFFDWVYLDASHDYKSVCEDLTVWYPKVKSGGYFMGHDYMDGVLSGSPDISTIFEVKKAVDEFAVKHNATVSITKEKAFPSWYFRKN
jgi:hypothetical protein